MDDGMKKEKKDFTTEDVSSGYADTDIVGKPLFKMADVYAGPEQMLRMGSRFDDGSTLPREFQAIYAAPDYWSPVPFSGPREDDDTDGSVYPFNNAASDGELFQMVYAAPDVMNKKTEPVDMTMINDSGKGMAFADTSCGIGGSDKDDRETVVCPSCGYAAHKGKFCEYCGAKL